MLSETYWIGRFPLIRAGERAPGQIWFSTICESQGPVEIGAAILWAGIDAAKVQRSGRPKRILGTIQAEDNGP